MDIWFYGWCLRIFWRGFIWPPLYGYHQYGFYGFGAMVGFMLWPPKDGKEMGANFAFRWLEKFPETKKTDEEDN